MLRKVRVISQRQLWNTSTLQKHNTGEEKQLLQRKRKCPTRHDCLHGVSPDPHMGETKDLLGRAARQAGNRKGQGTRGCCSSPTGHQLPVPQAWRVRFSLPCLPAGTCPPAQEPQLCPGCPQSWGPLTCVLRYTKERTLPVPTPAHSPAVPSGPKFRPSPY